MTWQTQPLANVADFNLGKMLDQKKNRGQEMPYLANVNVRWGEFELDDLREMRFEDHEAERFGLRFGDIVMCEGGEPGRCAIWKEQIPGMMYQKALHRIRPHDCLDSRFLYYTFLKMGRNNAFAGLFTGSTIKHLPKEKLAKLEISYPALDEQRRIASILSAYDDLIENNRRRIALLEDAARQLYKEWFVRFRFPGHEHVKVIDGVPEGWQQLDLGSVATNLDRRRVPLSVMQRELRQGQYPYHGAAGILDYVDGYIFEGRHLLLGEDGTVQTKSGTPMLQLVDGKFWVSNHAHVLQGVRVTTELLYCALSNYQIVGHVTGVAQPKITQANMNRIPIVLPTTNLREQFQDAISPIFDMTFCLSTQNQQLAKARDILLPKLMNGTLTV